MREILNFIHNTPTGFCRWAGSAAAAAAAGPAAKMRVDAAAECAAKRTAKYAVGRGSARGGGLRVAAAGVRQKNKESFAMKKRETAGCLMLFVTAMIWGSAFLAQQSGMEHIGPFTMQTVRYLLAGLVLLPFVAIFDKTGKITKKPVTREERRLQYGSGAICGVLLCVASILQQYGLIYTSVGKSGFITALYIVLVPLIGLLFGRKTDVFTWIYALIAVAGLYILSMSGAVTVNKGDLLTLCCAVGFALHILKIDSVTGRVDGVRLACTQFFVCAALSAVGMVLLERPVWSDILAGWFPIVYAGVLSGGVAYTMQILGQQSVPPTLASMIMSLESVFAALFGWIIGGQTLSGRELAGCAMMFAAIVLSQLPRPKLAKKA